MDMTEKEIRRTLSRTRIEGREQWKIVNRCSTDTLAKSNASLSASRRINRRESFVPILNDQRWRSFPSSEIELRVDECVTVKKKATTLNREHTRPSLSLSIRKEEEVTWCNKQNADELVVWLKNRHQRKNNPLELSSHISLPLQLNPIQTDCFLGTRARARREARHENTANAQFSRREIRWSNIRKRDDTSAARTRFENDENRNSVSTFAESRWESFKKTGEK